MDAFTDCIEATLDEVLPAAGSRPGALAAAMRYAVGSGGKRIRPRLCLAAAAAAGGRADDARYPAAAVELLHNYTLVHDDLPAMDDDVERRGRPTVWKAFGEAEAILAGDALQALAFRTAARAPRNAAAIVAALADAGVGVVGGQVEDLAADRNARARADAAGGGAPFVYLRKTADLFVAAAVCGALAAGGSEADVARLREYARCLGLAFQYEDDLIDGDGAFPADETARRAEEATACAVAALGGLPGDTAFLESLAKGLVGRKR